MLGNIENSISSPLSSPHHFGLLVKLNCTHIIDTRAPAANVAIQYWKRIRDRMIQPTSIKVKVLDGIDRASAYEQTGSALRRVARSPVCGQPIRKWRIDISSGDVKGTAENLEHLSRSRSSRCSYLLRHFAPGIKIFQSSLNSSSV